MIRLDDVTVSFGGKTVLDRLNLHVARGEKLVIRGSSGQGKSTIFRLILGFVQPDSGAVVFDGRPLSSKAVWEVRRRIAYVDQDVSLGQGTVSQWFDFVAGLRANSKADFSGKKVSTTLGLFGLEPDVLDKDTNALSGGERQRVALALAVMLNRDLFLLDEVTTGLDPTAKARVIDLLCGRPDWTVIVIAHDKAWSDHPGVRVFDLEAGQ
jgi:putative ABC transport system ATP-binding protein